MSLHILRWPAVVGVALLGSALAPALAQNQPKLVINDVTVRETHDGARFATFTVSIAGETSHGYFAVDFMTVGGTATEGLSCDDAGVDFVGVHQVLRQTWAFFPETPPRVFFSPTDATREIAITVCGDTRHEPDETFVIQLYNANGAVIQDGKGQATIVDDDPPPPPWEGLAFSSKIAKAEERRWQTPPLPAGDYQFSLSGTGGDADLYVRTGAAPTLNNYSCRPLKNGSNETCIVQLGEPAIIHVMVRGQAPSSVFMLVGGAR